MAKWLLALVLVSTAPAVIASSAIAEWPSYEGRFVTPDGRVVDTGNGGISHSEGQGTGMLLAVENDDRASFERIWNWTHTHLQVRTGDKLFAWKWNPVAGGGAVSDSNDAADGDLLIGWALLRAGRLWKNHADLSAAKEIFDDIKLKLFKPTKYGLVLIPGEQGFATKDGMLVVNLSYWVFPAFAEIQSFDGDPRWTQLSQTGRTLISSARFGRWQLPPDWLLLGDTLKPAPDFKPNFGYDAIRIPLYLIWGKQATKQSLQPFINFWKYFKGAAFLPAWTNLLDDSVDSYNAGIGIHDVVALVLNSAHAGPPPVPSPTGIDAGYYSASLHLLTKLAAKEAK